MPSACRAEKSACSRVCLLPFADDDQLAAVLSHEISHALAHHVSERMARERTVGHGLLSLSYDRQQESEADHIGVFLMTFAGYDPNQALAFWQEMEEAGHGRIPERYYPIIRADERRMQQLKGWIPLAKAAKTSLRRASNCARACRKSLE